MSEEPLFKIKNVTKYFGNKKVLSNISFNIMPGEILGIIGASGSGKTTLLNILIGFIRPERGNLKFRFEHLLSFKNTEVYRNINKKPLEIKKMIGFAAQKPSFYYDLTVQENLEYFGSLFNLAKDALTSNIEALLNLMELKSSRYILAQNLSGGMQRRLDIACSLVHDPKVLILDEPTSDLDPILRNHIWELINVIRSKGTTIILSSHHLTEIEHMCDRIAILKNGSFAELNTFEYIKKKYIQHKKVIIKLKKSDHSKFIKKINKKLWLNYEVKNKELIIATSKPNKLIQALIKKCENNKNEILSLQIATPSLDEIFVSIAKNKEGQFKEKENYDYVVNEEIGKLNNKTKSKRNPKKQRRPKKTTKKKGKKSKKGNVIIYD
jgi:ABC-2 type transport system ATP-binding protein